ncbi:GntR family transcriptional regulator [Desulfogranum mediterraneum]|uniref:GntR family transcriptional regulator n=1 Tax=Desulfogranum mediterraneum TaxID=160661 RepID=UPI000A00C5A4|nr:GntR family transcriptional regulator [Desulfogranum mediterraneum]
MARVSKVELAYDKIFHQIMTSRFEPGQQLEEKQLMETLDIGRTPIREALMRLEINMMVESRSGKGFTVRPVTLQSTRAVFETLSILENGVAALAVGKECAPQLEAMRAANQQLQQAADRFDALAMVRENYAFHLAFAECSRNEYLIHGLTAVQCETRRLAYLSFGDRIDERTELAEHYQSVIEEHQQIISSLEGRDIEHLREIIDRHAEAFKKRIVDFLLG